MKKMMLLVFLLFLLSSCSPNENNELQNDIYSEDIFNYEIIQSDGGKVWRNVEPRESIKFTPIIDYVSDEFDLLILAFDGPRRIYRYQIVPHERIMFRLSCDDKGLAGVGGETPFIGGISNARVDKYCKNTENIKVSVNSEPFEGDQPLYETNFVFDQLYSFESEITYETLTYNAPVPFSITPYVYPTIIVLLILIILYNYLYHRNMNRFIQSKKPYKLPSVLLTFSVLVISSVVLLVIINVSNTNEEDNKLRIHSFVDTKIDYTYYDKEINIDIIGANIDIDIKGIDEVLEGFISKENPEMEIYFYYDDQDIPFFTTPDSNYVTLDGYDVSGHESITVEVIHKGVLIYTDKIIY